MPFELLFGIEIAKICDYFYPTYGERYDKQFKHLNKGFESPNNIKPYSIIYADLSLFFEFFVFSQIKVPFILVTNDSPRTVPYIDFSRVDPGFFQSVLDNPYLIKIFSTNVDSNHPKLSCIPVGLPKHIPFIVKDEENNEFMGWYSIYIYQQVSDYIKNIGVNRRENIKRTSKKLLHCKFTDVNTKKPHHKFIDIRRHFIDKLEEKNIVVDQSNSIWEDYIQDLKNYKFSLCLPGVGIDCIRTWESLTLGVIPIVINSPLNVLYEDLPVVIIESPDDLTEEFLNKQFDIITDSARIDRYNWEKISSNYWKNKILRTKYEYILKNIDEGDYVFH